MLASTQEQYLHELGRKTEREGQNPSYLEWFLLAVMLWLDCVTL